MHIRSTQVPPPIEELNMKNLSNVKEYGRYTWEKKYSVVVLYLQCGNMRLTAEKSGVTPATIENWRKSIWWEDMVQEIKNTDSTEHNNQLTKLIKKTMAVMEDRLDKGDKVLNNKTGELMDKPVTLRDATAAANALMQRQTALSKTQNELQVQKQTTQDILKGLAAEFAKMTNKPIIAEDIEFVEVIPEGEESSPT